MELEPNYYQETPQQDGMQYRLDATDIIEDCIDTLKGGVERIENGKKIYFKDQELMNALGIARARMILGAGINKISHLTNFKDEERVFRQVKSMVRTWIYEIVLNIKKWAPEAKYINGKLVNPTYAKIRNKHLVVSVVENGILQSMQRGLGGFEAQITGKQYVVSEHKDYSTERREDSQSMGGFFGGRQ